MKIPGPQKSFSPISLLLPFSPPGFVSIFLHLPHLHIFLGFDMASSLRIGTSALRSSIAKPVQSAALNGARCYSSAKAKVGAELAEA